MNRAAMLLGSLFDPEDGDVPPKRRLTFAGLHSVISQKMHLFFFTAVKASNPIKYVKFLHM
jgi:hypothetical protein